MKLAYFTNQYPKVSHSFIRREILALESMGHSVERFALRADESELVDPMDQKEFDKTSYILAASKFSMIIATLTILLSKPITFFSTLSLSIQLGYRSDRGVLRNVAYFIESCVLLRWQQNKAIEHIHSHFGTNSTMVVMLAHLLGGSNYSFTVHGPEEFDKPEFLSLSDKIKNSRFVVAISSYGKSQLFRWLPHEEWSKVKIIHCGLDSDFLADREKPLPNLSKQLVCVGRLCEQKGQLLLLEAMKILRDKGISCELILAGDGPMRQELERRISEYNLEQNVKITGWISSKQVRAILETSRGLVLPSFAEGLPVVIMEALALYRPVITTYVAGIPELVKNQDNGWLIPAGDSMKLASAMSELLNANSAQLLTMGINGYNAVKEQHDINIEVKKLALLFTENSAVES